MSLREEVAEALREHMQAQREFMPDDMAQAVLAVVFKRLREPSGAMVSSGSLEAHGLENARRTWRAMLDQFEKEAGRG